MKNIINLLRFWELKIIIHKKKFNLLDVGCGNGSFVELAIKNGIKTLGVDKKHTTHPQIIYSSIEKLQLNKKFDVITMFHVIEHVDNPEFVLKKAYRLLKNDGWLVLELPLTTNLTEKFLQDKYFAYYDKTHKNLWSKNEWLRLINKCNFIVEKQGLTLYEFPLTIITTSFRQGIIKGIISLFIFLPLKVLTGFGFNDEIVRFYCVKIVQ